MYTLIFTKYINKALIFVHKGRMALFYNTDFIEISVWGEFI
jgi:hypothetical protein